MVQSVTKSFVFWRTILTLPYMLGGQLGDLFSQLVLEISTKVNFLFVTFDKILLKITKELSRGSLIKYSTEKY